VQYGRTRLTVPKAGHYNLRIKPSKRIMTALRSGKRLKVQLTLVFTPAGTTRHIRIVHNVAVQMKHRPKKQAKH
jgi:VCBS repeat-containing protein